MPRLFSTLGTSLALLAVIPAIGRTADGDLREQAARGLRKAVGYFRTQVAVEGTYLWRYSDDLARREGEGPATAQQAWVQPPGTPTVGLAYLAAYEATREDTYLEAVRETARGLVRGQLQSGGWDYRIDFDPAARRGIAYRVSGGTGGKNVTTLDDDNTQAALRFLMQSDDVLGRKDSVIHDAVLYALDSLLKAQYPNGAWPQRYDAFPDPTNHPVKRASYPDTWSREYPGKDYRAFYTLNDGTLDDLVDVMFEATRRYGDARYRAAAERAGGFLILAQLPEPQPGWAQQYDSDMRPAWARKFEPPAVTGGEGQGAMRTLLRLHRETGDVKYLEPLPRAFAYYQRSALPDGHLARFYELKTNRPLYCTKDYRITYDDSDVPTHYDFKVSNKLDALSREYARAKVTPATPAKPRSRIPSMPRDAQVRAVLVALDAQGRWVEDGKLKTYGPNDPTRRVIETRTFVRNAGILSDYLTATRPR